MHCRNFHCLQFAGSVCLHLDGFLKGEREREREREREERERERELTEQQYCE